jgi:hypothetical protein
MITSALLTILMSLISWVLSPLPTVTGLTGISEIQPLLNQGFAVFNAFVDTFPFLSTFASILLLSLAIELSYLTFAVGNWAYDKVRG